MAPLIVSTGHAEVDLKTVDIELGIAFSTRELSDGHVVPFVLAVDVKCDINRRDIKIHLFGDLITDFAAIFEPIMKGPISDAIEVAVRATLSDVIPDTTNSLIGVTDALLPFPLPNWFLDW